MNIVIPVRPGDRNPELMFTLRSMERNFPHDRVWIVGYQPNWVTNVEFIPGNTHTPRSNLWHNLLAVCSHPDVPDEFVVTNDDIIVTQPAQPEILYRGPLKDHIGMDRVQRGATWWRESLQHTLTYLQGAGHPNPISYELHVPLPVNKQAMCETLTQACEVTPHNPIQWRTLYGNLHNIGGTQSEDSKAYRAGPIRTPYHSTEDRSFRNFAPQLKTLFPEPSRYEKS